MNYYYVRSSTNNIKEIERQKEAMQASTDHIIFDNAGDGFMALLKKIRTNDIIVVSDIDRLAKGDADKAIELYQQLLDIGVKVYEIDKDNGKNNEINLEQLIAQLKKYSFLAIKEDAE